MTESAYRTCQNAGLKSCASCGTPTDPARLVYGKSGELLCASCESGRDGEVRLARGALGSAVAAFVFGFFGMIALVLLAESVLGIVGLVGRHSAGKAELRLTGVWLAFLGVIVVLAGRTIADAHRTLSTAAVRRVVGSKRTRLLLLSWAGLPLVPFLGFLYVAFMIVGRDIKGVSP